MMTNLLRSAFAANKLFSTIARLRLLLVTFLTLMVSVSAWGADVTFNPSTDKGSVTANGTTSTGDKVTKSGFTITSSNGVMGNGSNYRVYQNGTLSITSTVGNITAISFTFSSDKYTGGFSNSYTGLSTTSWSASATSQARITKITITYTPTSTTKHTVTLEAGSGSVINTKLTEASAGAGVELPTPTLNGCDEWTFAGWKTSSAVTTETTTKPTLIAAGIYKPASNITLYAVYQRIETTEGGGSVTPQTDEVTISDFGTGTSTRTYSPDYATWTWKKNAGSDIATYEQIRLYQKHSMTISPKSGYSISKIIATCTSTDYASALAGGSLSGASKSVSGSTVTITPTSGDIVITQSAQSRVSQFQVTYTSSSGGSTTYYHSTPQCADPCASLAAPSVTATNITSNSFTLSWNAVDGATSYNIYNYTTEDLDETTSLTYTFTGLSSETEYEWEVESAKGECFKGTKGTTTTSATPCEKLGAATDLTVETDFVQDGQTYVKFSWTPAAPSKEGTTQKLCYGLVGQEKTCKESAKNLGEAKGIASNLPAGEYEWSIQALGDGTNYCDGDVVEGTNFYIYSIAYNTNGGDVIAATSGTALPNPLPTTTKTGYTFAGWYTDSECNTPATAGAAITQNTTLYAKWTAKTYTVTLDNQGATTAGAASVTATYNAAMPSIASNLPEKTGYTFGGYFTEQNGEGTQYYNQSGGAYNNKKWDQATNATLYAKWTANKYTVKFNGNDNTGGSMNDQSFTYGQAQNLTANAFTRTGYTFKGWNTNKSGSGTSYTDGQEVINLNSTSGGQITLYAQWTELPKYTVSFSTGTGNPTQAAIKETTGGAGITLPAGPTPACSADDWKFAGWAEASVEETTTEPTLLSQGNNYKPTEDCTLYAVYSKEETDDNGGTTSTEASLSFANKAQRTSYSTDKQVWGQNGITLTNNKSASTSNVGDYANPARFYAGSQIIINAPGNITQIVATCTDGAEDLYNSVSNQEASVSDNDVTIIPTESSHTYTIDKLTKQVKMSSLTVTYLAESGPTTTTTYNSNPTCDICENILTINKGAETNGTFTLDKVGKQETCDGLSVLVTPTPAEHYHVASVTASTSETAENNGDGTYTITYAANSTGESTINVTFVQDAKASITFSELGVTTTDNTTYYVGETYTLPSTSSQSCDGKQLVGWSTVEVAETDTKPTENYYELGAEVTLVAEQTFYAVYASRKGADIWEKTDIGNINAIDEVVITMSKDTYTYALTNGNGTSDAPNATLIEIANNVISTNIPKALIWNIDQNNETLTIYPNGTTATWLYCTDTNNGVRVGTNVNKTFTIDVTSGYLKHINTLRYVGVYIQGPDWRCYENTSGNIVGQTLAFYKKTSSLTNYTTSCVASYSITYDFAGGTGSHCSNTSVPQGAPYTICDEAPTREGHTFQGWSDGTSTYAAGTTITPTSDVTLTAIWQINTYTVTWSNNGATTPVTYTHGDALVVPAAPASCDGVKEFIGWTADNTFTYHATTPPSDLFTEKTTTVTANATYYAVFATQGEGSANFVLGESGTFKMYANVNGTNYYAQGGVSSSKITSTTEAANASDYTLTHKGSNQYTIQLGNAYIGHSGTSSTDLNTTETTWTIQEGINGSWRIVSPVNTSRALAYRASTYKIFKAYSMTSVEAGDTEYYDIEFGGVSSGYSDYTTTCQQIESIEVQSPKNEFYLTDDFTIGSGKVIATLSGGGTTDVTTLATFSGYNMNEVGTYTVTVTYMGATATYEINVKPLDNAWVLTWNVSGKTNTGLGPRYVNKGSDIGTLPTPVVPDACEGKTFMGWTKSNIVPSDGVGIEYITEETVPTDNTTYYAVFATVNNFCTQKPINDITDGSKVVIVAISSLDDNGGIGKAISSRASADEKNLDGDDVVIYDATINTPHSTCIWTIKKRDGKYYFTQEDKYLYGLMTVEGNNYIQSFLKYGSIEDGWSVSDAESGLVNTYYMQSTNASGQYIEWYDNKFKTYSFINESADFDMQFFVTANANGEADITDYTTGCTEYTITYYGFRGGYSTSTSSDGIIVLPVNSMHTVPNCGDVVKDHTNLGREFLDVWMTQPHGGHTFKPGDTFILTQDTTLYAQWKMETTSDVTTLPTDIEDLAGTDVYVYGGKTLNIQPGTTTINSLTLKGGLQADGSYKMPIVWVPEGATLVRNSNKIYLDLVVNAKNYYPFAVPFATKNDQYIDYLDPVLNKASTYGTHFVIKTYDGARRADVGEDRANNWVKVLRHATDKPSSLQPGVGYIIQALTYPDKDTATIRIPMTVPNTWFENGEQAVVGSTARNTIAVIAHAGDAATKHQRHAGWNFVASPYLTNFAGSNVENDGNLAYINGELTVNGGWQYGGDNVPYVTIPAYDFSYYTQHKLSDVKLSPEWSFFVQIGKDGTMDFSTAGRQEIPASIAARHDAAPSSKMDVDITLSDKNHSDQMGLIICDHFSSAYEVGYDLEKMFGSAYNLTVYTLMEDNTPLAYHALAIHSNMQVIPVGYRVPEQGDYTFALNQSTSSIDLLNEQYEQLILVDYETGALTNLLNSTYTFTSPRTQSDSRFAIYAVIRQKTPTDLPNIDDGDNSTRKILHNGHLYILRDGKVYNGNGQIVK